MGKLVTPKVFLIGYTTIDMVGLVDYLKETGNEDFIQSLRDAKDQGLNDGEILCSFYAKLCYASLTLGHNKNVSRIRDIPDNLINCFNQGHGSVFEHCQLNFVATNCSRVLTHELCRHRAGWHHELGGDTDSTDWAYSQTSGRYVRGDELNIVFDPALEPVKEEVEFLQSTIEETYQKMVKKAGLDDMKDFTKKKQITSALRYLLPCGISNEIGFSCNLRALRHVAMLRTSRHAAWEIRQVFNQVYQLVKAQFPLIFYGAKEEMVDGLLEVSGMRLQPYEEGK